MSNMVLKFRTLDGWFVIPDVLDYTVKNGVYMQYFLDKETGKHVPDMNDTYYIRRFLEHIVTKANTHVFYEFALLSELWEQGHNVQVDMRDMSGTRLSRELPLHFIDAQSRPLIETATMFDAPADFECLLEEPCVVSPFMAVTDNTAESPRMVITNDVCYCMHGSKTVQKIEVVASAKVRCVNDEF